MFECVTFIVGCSIFITFKWDRVVKSEREKVEQEREEELIEQVGDNRKSYTMSELNFMCEYSLSGD